MSRFWGVDVRDWWLPNSEGFPPILRATRDFVQGRMGAPKDQFSQDVQDINGIFPSLHIHHPNQAGEAGEVASGEYRGENATATEALAALDEANVQQIAFDDQTITSDDSSPRF